MSLNDEELVGTEELLADGTDTIFTGATVVSTTTGTKVIVLSGVDLFREPEQLEELDTVTLSGTSPDVDGDYTVDEVLSITSFSVKEAIGSSTGGTCTAKYPSGARKVGFDPTALPTVTATNVQDAMEELGASVGDDDQVKDNVPAATTFTVKVEHQHIVFDEFVVDGEYVINGEGVILAGLPETTKESFRKLLYYIDDGPAEWSESGAYRERGGNQLLPTSIIWYVDATKTAKIVEKNIVWSLLAPVETEVEWILYAEDGSSPLITVTDVITYEDNIFEVSRTRTILVN